MVFGPLVGGCVVVLSTALHSFVSVTDGPNGAEREFADALKIVPVVAIFSYVLGGIPAALTGIWLGWNILRGRAVDYRAAAISGAMFSLPLGLFLVSNDALNLMTAARTLLTIGWYCLLGACAAAACLWICRCFRLVEKPSPV